MLHASRPAIIGFLFVIPALLCLIGIGAFLHVAVRAAATEHEQHGRQVQDQTQKAEELKARIRELEKRIERIRARLAEMRAADELQKDAAQLQKRKAELERQLSKLLAELKEIQEQLNQTTGAADELRRRLEEALKRLQELQEELAAAEPTAQGKPEDGQPPPGPSAKDLAQAIANAKRLLEEELRKIEQAEAELDGLRQQNSLDAVKVEKIIGSTNWKPPPNPLYVECDGQGVVLQPEGVRAPADPDEQRRQWFGHIARGRGYVLFLIRPSGFDSFIQYRSVVVQQKLDYGYEPINENGRVIYPSGS